ncbi:YceD family protein [Acidisoma sp.]|uniref:YceD family protein n=1 Tax=Acidisoma sp. TaxID=1872115 RepID=UPI003AFFBC87
MTPEFSRLLPVAQIGMTEASRSIEATPEECALVAARLGLSGLTAFTATFRIARQAGGDEYLAQGRIHARALRTCVVSLEDFTERSDLSFTIRFVTEEASEDEALEAPYDYEDGPDEVLYDNDTLDLGEAAVQEYALSLNPYPRKPGAKMPDLGQEGTGAFDVLRNLTRRN